MTLADFNKSVQTDKEPPAGMTASLQALWWEAKGDWHKAHVVAQDDPSPNAAWVHAFLHRVEGDEANAAYWYAKAVKPVAHGPFPPERDHIVESLLASK